MPPRKTHQRDSQTTTSGSSTPTLDQGRTQSKTKQTLCGTTRTIPMDGPNQKPTTSANITNGPTGEEIPWRTVIQSLGNKYNLLAQELHTDNPIFRPPLIHTFTNFQTLSISDFKIPILPIAPRADLSPMSQRFIKAPLPSVDA